MSATLRITRGGLGVQLRRGTFDIELDGQSVGTLTLDQSTEVPIETGHHTLRMTEGRYSSKERCISLPSSFRDLASSCSRNDRAGPSSPCPPLSTRLRSW
jgi:hypothetical protein